MQLLGAILVLLLLAALMVGMYVDLERLRREVELDELWDDGDEVGAGRGATSSSARALVATTAAVGADDLIGGAA
jgi:hypothetical protein